LGVEYYAINIQDKTFYELGKGGWYELNYEPEAFSDLEYLTLFILEDCYFFVDGDMGYSDEEVKRITDYITNRVAPALFEMMRDTPPDKIKVVNDCGDDITICKAKGYRCIGTRYGSPGTKEYEEDVERLNCHFRSTNPKHWYNPEDYKKYPEYDIY
jgi:hypothetical protein